ncbi:MAG TPA: alpha/beta hydrolase domain-containing protein, partial [bacterium]|nr:alpha/beta hydrolase domain-containing protein [bacterium]
MRLRIDSVEPLAQGQAFGSAGAYERVTGVAYGEVDPLDARNQVIVNLDKAPRNARGLVEYQADFFILRPAQPARGNGTLLYEVTNRGRKLLMRSFLDAELYGPPGNNDPRTAADLGNGWLLRQGYTLLWSGWDPDAPRVNHGMGMVAPLALEGGAPLAREIRDELVSATRSPGYEPARRFRITYPAASVAAAQARLTVRRRAADPEQEVPRERWRLLDERTLELLPEGSVPEPGSLYEFYYFATSSPVLGLGLAAVRDVVAHLRSGAADPDSAVRGPLQAVLAVGISQGGRFLRDFIHLGFNQDVAGRKVFDGVLTHVAGAGGLFLNWEFGQPSRTNTQHQDHSIPECSFPFSTASLVDPVTGYTGSLFRQDGF